VLIATEMPAARALVEKGRVTGVQIGDKGINRAGEKKPNYQPGAICNAKATVLCEGPRGTLAKQLDATLGLSVGKNPQVYSTGVKELWEMPPGRAEGPRDPHHELALPPRPRRRVHLRHERHPLVGGLRHRLDYKDPPPIARQPGASRRTPGARVARVAASRYLRR
jgi:electron-transferring-flavoprotein dehydrogenase